MHSTYILRQTFSTHALVIVCLVDALFCFSILLDLAFVNETGQRVLGGGGVQLVLETQPPGTYPSDEAENGKGEEQELYVRTSRFHRIYGGGVEDSSTVVVLPEAADAEESTKERLIHLSSLCIVLCRYITNFYSLAIILHAKKERFSEET